MKTIDLNADIGESFGRWSLGNDPELLKYISSANIACGFHAGDPAVMRKTVIQALELDVSIGAHPAFPDLQGFGRRVISLSEDETVAMLIYQIGALRAIVEAEGGRLNHVKAHGALYNTAVNNSLMANSIAYAISKTDDSLVMFGLPGSCLEEAARKFKLKFAVEAFADRAYADDGSLIPRGTDGAFITDKTDCINRVRRMIIDNRVTTLSGKEITIVPDTICIHGDNEKAVLFASELRKNIEDSAISLKPVS